ncbi:MAG: alpha/beta hydrolase [Hyphomonadaceae bacterium]|nr:alpha/beta hydrolase [Hyphomonadaceae bacterium]
MADSTDDNSEPNAPRRDVLKGILGAPVVAAFASPAFASPNEQPPTDVFKPHAYSEQTVDLGEVKMNYVVAGSPSKPAILIIPAQTESWWGYEKAIKVLEKDFQVYAADLRGQGRTTWTPRRYTLDNMGNDLVRFIDIVIKRPVITTGCSSGGVLSAWLSAWAKPGQIRASHYEDPPLFASETEPLYGHSIKQAAGPFLEAFGIYLGDQWRVGNVPGLIAALQKLGRGAPPSLGAGAPPPGLGGSPASLREYDPEWGRSFVQGLVARSCPHDVMLAQVKVPVMFTHHARSIDPKTGGLVGAISDFQVEKVRELVTSAGQKFELVDCPDAAHTMHAAEPERFAKILGDWAKKQA